MENASPPPGSSSLPVCPQGLDVTPAEFVKSDEIFFRLVDTVDEYAIFALSLEGIVMTWNAGGQRLKGYTPKEIIGTHFSRFYTSEDLDRNHPAHELKMAAEQGKYQEEGWRVKKDGTVFWASVVITALHDETGALCGYGKVTRDHTQKRQAELALKESEERFRLLISNVRDYAIITLDTDGNVITWNAGAERIKGYHSSEILGKHVSNFYPPSEIEAGKAEIELRIARDEGYYEEEGWRVRKNGTMFWANITLTPMKDDNGTLRGFAKVTRDLTEKKKAEDALREAYNDLERRIEVRTREYAEAKQKAEAAVKARDEFFSMASHELKTPLASLKMQTQIRKRNISRGNFEDFAPEKLAELCDSDERQIERLVFLVDNMLDISKLTSGTFKLMLETFSMKELIEDVMIRLQPLLQQSKNLCKVSIQKDEKVCWDRHRIEQVLTNLLSNAGKYAPGTPVEVNVSVNPEKITLRVKDSGRGISAEDQKRIFSSYERVEDRGETTGLGLGLYITSQIVEAHHGKIHIESQLGQGSTFIVELPIDATTTAKS